MSTTEPTDPTLHGALSATFGICQQPERHWPRHGRLALRNRTTSRYVGSTIPIFSIAGLRAMLVTCTEKKILTADEATEIERQAGDQLPTEMHRYDLIFAHHGAKRANEIVDRMTRSQPIPPGTEQARFEACANSELCQHPNCAKHGAHGRILLEGFSDTSVGTVLFSTAAAFKVIEEGVKHGDLSSEDASRIQSQVLESSLTVSTELTRADRVMMSKNGLEMMAIDYVFGVVPPEALNEPARFSPGDEACEIKHVHLHGSPVTLECPGPLYTRFQALAAVNHCYEQGLLSDEEVGQLREQTETLELPQGYDGDPMNMVARREEEQIKSVVGGLLLREMPAMLQELLGDLMTDSRFSAMGAPSMFSGRGRSQRGGTDQLAALFSGLSGRRGGEENLVSIPGFPGLRIGFLGGRSPFGPRR